MLGRYDPYFSNGGQFLFLCASSACMSIQSVHISQIYRRSWSAHTDKVGRCDIYSLIFSHSLHVSFIWISWQIYGTLLYRLIICFPFFPYLFWNICQINSDPRTYFWLIWHKCQRAFVIMNCLLYVVIIVRHCLWTVLPVVGFITVTSFLTRACTYVPRKCTWNTSSIKHIIF